MFYVTGDTHGVLDFDHIKKIRKQVPDYRDYLFILGDVAIAWDESSLENNVRLYESLGYTILFIDGNHENFPLLYSFPISTILGAKAHQVSDHIFHIIRGEVLDYNGMSVLCIGGAKSSDRVIRRLGFDYWDEEMISPQDIANAFANIKKHSGRFDYIFTHCCDSFTVSNCIGYEVDESTDQLSNLDDMVTYRMWLFGHYHKDARYAKDRLCIYQWVYRVEKDGLYDVNDGRRLY